MKKLFELLKQDFWKNNAIFVQMLGLCPTLAVTSSAVNALGLSIATTCILTLTNTMVSLLRKIILPEVRIPVYVLLIASLVTCTQIIMEAFRKAGITSSQRTSKPDITKLTLYELGLSGGDGSRQLRQALQKHLGLPSLMSAQSLLEVLNTMMTAEELSSLMETIRGQSDGV